MLELIRVSGPISRIELAAATAMTPASMTTAVRDLIADGLVEEVGVGGATGGKRRTLLQARPDARFAVGVLLGFEGISYALVNAWGEPVSRRASRGAGADEPQEVIDRVATEVAEIIGESGIDSTLIAGAGIVVPGPIDSITGSAVQLPSSLPWSRFDLRGALRDALGVPVVMENDATAAAVGEYWAQATGGARSFATVHMGLGIGAGIVVGGEPLRGVSANAGELGHVSVNMDGDLCHCGNRGCLELTAAPWAARERYAALTGRDRAWAEIASRAAAGADRDAVDVVHRSAEALAVAMTGLVNLLDIEVVVLTGEGFGEAAPIFATHAQRVLDQAFFARRSHRVRVLVSAEPGWAAALGGASLVLRELLAR